MRRPRRCSNNYWDGQKHEKFDGLKSTVLTRCKVNEEVRMSAWVVSKAHIDALVTAGAQFGLIATAAEAAATGEMLWWENVRSVSYRYNDQSLTPVYEMGTTEADLHPVAVLKVLACYDYQSCEHPDWTESAACVWTQRLREAVLATLPASATDMVRYGSLRVARYETWPAFQDTPWGVDSLDQVAGHAPPVLR